MLRLHDTGILALEQCDTGPKTQNLNTNSQTDWAQIPYPRTPHDLEKDMSGAVG